MDATLLGAHPVSRWMEDAPGTLAPSTTLDQAIKKMRVLGAQTLPVVDDAGTYVGLASAIDLALARQSETDMASSLDSLKLPNVHVTPTALPSKVLEVLQTSGLPGIPVVNDSLHVVGWVSQQSLIERLYRDQRRAIAARAQSSWGSRFQEKHSHRHTS